MTFERCSVIGIPTSLVAVFVNEDVAITDIIFRTRIWLLQVSLFRGNVVIVLRGSVIAHGARPELVFGGTAPSCADDR